MEANGRGVFDNSVKIFAFFFARKNALYNLAENKWQLRKSPDFLGQSRASEPGEEAIFLEGFWEGVGWMVV